MSDLTTTQNGHVIVWEGHLCEGAQMVAADSGTFLLWARCKKCDIPANEAKEGSIQDITCSECLELL